MGEPGASEGLVVTVPRIATERLLLREFRTGDFEGFATNIADPEATRFLLSSTTDRRTAWRVFSSAAGGWVLSGAGWWAVEVRESGEMVGTVGAFMRESFPDLEIGWTLYRRFWGNGYATEAARAALAFAFDVHRAKRVVAHIAPQNAPSIAVSERLGMTFETDVDLYGERTRRCVIAR
jgi:RimJ/RimL family protein N-acetyltransferase